MTHTQTQGADGAGTKTAAVLLPLDDPNRPLNDSGLPSAMIWAGGEAYDELRADQSLDLDSCSLAVGIYRAMTEAHAKEIATLSPAPAATPGVPDSVRALLERLAKASQSLAEFPPNGLVRGDLYVAAKNEGQGTGWRYVCSGASVSDLDAAASLIAAQPAGQAGDAGAEDESALSDRKELSGQNVSLSPLRGQIANAKATGVNGEMAAGEAYTVFDPARTTSDPYDDRPGPWYDMKKVREIEAATGIAFAAAHPERALGRDTDGLIEGFAAALKAKLRAAEAKYGWQNGWLKDDWSADCQRELMRHVGKGDPLDVAAYAAFCWHHGWSTSSAPTGTPDTEKCLSALTAAVSTCINDKGITDLGTIKRAWFYARTGRDEPVGSRAWDELRAMVRASEASSDLEGVETIQVWPLVEPAPNSTRTGAAETIPVPVELVKMAHKLTWSVSGDAYLGKEPEKEIAEEVDAGLFAAQRAALAARPEAPSDAGWSREDLEAFVAREWPEGRSAGAAARELVRALGVRGLAPTLQRLLTDLLGQINFASTDRAQILADFANAAPEAARMAKIDSFERWNPRVFDPTPPSDPAPSGQAEGIEDRLSEILTTSQRQDLSDRLFSAYMAPHGGLRLDNAEVAYLWTKLGGAL